MDMSLILASDQSTSATRTELLDLQGKVRDKPALSYRRSCLQPGCVEHDARKTWQNLLTVIHDVARRNRVMPPKLSAGRPANQRVVVNVKL